MRPVTTLIRSHASSAVKGVVLDRGLDVQGDLRRRVEPRVRDLVKDRAVSLVSDAGEDGDRRLAKQLCQLEVIEPSQIGYGAPASNQNERIERSLSVSGQRSEDSVLDR